jgi:rRNA maturation endonuclease Nob1
MAQDIIGIRGETHEVESPLVVCKGCGKTVPRTNLCIYCGSPILFRGSNSS